jgi:hypothetical protein
VTRRAADAELQIAAQRTASCIRTPEAADLGEGQIKIREVGLDPLAAAFATGLRQFHKAGDDRANGAPSAVALVREPCNLSVGAATAVPE